MRYVNDPNVPFGVTVMFAGSTHSPTKAPAPLKVARADGATQKQQENNPVWQSLALGSLRVQPKLSISQPGDADEREADQIADRVMRMATPQSACSCSPSRQASGKVQRKCSGCEEEEERVQRKSQSAEKVSTANVGQALNSQGRPLDAGMRSFMESRFGHDFSSVRVHDDSHSATSAESIHAKAYTVGPNIVFGAGMYQPGTNDGRRLLAHELAHTVQQNSSGLLVQRDINDFLVTEVQPDPEKRTKGMSDRFFFEGEQSTFRKEVPEEAAELARLEAWAKAHAGEHVRLVGRSSQEESGGKNADMAWARVVTVKAVLKSHGVIVDDAGINLTSKQRPVEYRFYRSVEIVTAAPTCTNFPQAKRKQDEKDCEKAFQDAHARATTIVGAAMDRLRPDTDPPPATPPPTGTTAPPRVSRDTILSNQFPGIDRATLLPLFGSIATRLGQVKDPKGGHTCNHRCQAGCERPASAGVGGPVEICAPFYVSGLVRSLPADERVYAVMHETTHSAVIPKSKPVESVGIDFAYASTRLFGVLTGSEALKNTDSFVMALLRLAEAAGDAPAALASISKAPADTLNLVTPDKEKGDRNRTARRALGFAQSWLNYSSFWAPDLYDYLNNSMKSWVDLDSFGHHMLELWTAPFQLNHPGTKGINADDKARIETFQKAIVARFTAPAITRRATQEDRTKVAGVYDRFTRMHETLHKSALTVMPSGYTDGTWSPTFSALPGLGTNVWLADSFFKLSGVDQARHIVRLMARAMSDIPRSWEESYVDAADGVHQYHKLGP